MNTLVITVAAIINVFIYALMIWVGVAIGRVIESRKALREIKLLKTQLRTHEYFAEHRKRITDQVDATLAEIERKAESGEICAQCHDDIDCKGCAFNRKDKPS